jgi:glutathione S-transferase
MLVMRSSTTSPFARKVRIALAVLGLADKVKIENADTLDPKDSVREQNPLGKIPTLVLEDGGTLFDSRTILEYLDDRAGGGRIIPRAGKARFDALRLQSLADGILDAGVLRVYEGRFRPTEKHEPKWIDHQAGKMDRALAVLEKAPPAFGPMIDVGQITLACALGYLDFRFGSDWRKTHPKLVKWLDEFGKKVPAFSETTPH